MKNFTIKQFFLLISNLFTNLLTLFGIVTRPTKNSYNNRAKKVEWSLLVVFLSFCGANLLYGQDNPLAPAQGFNVMVYSGGVSLNQGDIDGGLATIGGLNLRGAFTLSGNTSGSYKVAGDANNTSLIVEGAVSYTSGSGMNVNQGGYIKFKDMASSKYWSTSPTRITASSASSQDANPRIEMSATQTLSSVNQDAFDFGTAFTAFQGYSDTYKSCASNVAVSTSSITSYTFTLTTGRSNFFKINASNLDDFNEIKFNIVPSATNPAIITVDLQGASTFNWPIPNFPGVPNAAGQYILFNFVNGATNATINLNGGSTVLGTLFAPAYKINKVGSGNIEGQVICNTYIHEAGEVHYQVFNTTVNCSSYSSVTCDCAGNLLLNPSFEIVEDRAGYSTANRTKYWDWTSAPSTALYTWTGYPVCDTYNAYLDATGGAKYVWQKVSNVTVGTSYSLSAYAGTHQPAYDHRIRLVFYNSAGTALLTKEVQVDWDVDVVVSGAPLQEYKLSGTAPAGTSYLRVEGYASADYLKLDNFCLTVDNTCNNLTSGGTIGTDQVLCKNAGTTDPTALTNVTSPSGGDTGVGIEYQWYSSTVLTNGACSTNMTGTTYAAIVGATAATYDPAVISQTTCYIRAARRVNCSDYVGLSNAVKVVVKNNCTVASCANNLVQNGGFETDNGAVNSTTGTKFPVSFMSSPASYITQTNGVSTTAYLGAQPQYWTIGTDVNDYLNKNGAFYIDASSTGNAYSGDRFVWGRVNQCLVFSLPNQSLIPVTEGKKYRICAYVAAFNPTSSVQGDAKFVFETYFRNANNNGAGLLDEQYNWKSATADADGKWETLGWQQVCQDVTAPTGATALEFYLTPNDDEGDGLAVDDICVTELTATTPPTVTSISKCGAGASTITVSGCAGGTVNWYDSMSNTTAFTTGLSFTTPSLTASSTYYVSCLLAGSESIKVPVSVIVNGAVTGVSATPSASYTCGTAVTINGAGTVTNPNLVTNGSFTDGNIGFGTEYGFQNWTNGGYGITTDASTYYTWASACKDRTAAGTGKIFVADGALNANASVWYQTIPVKANTTYRLSVYASSLGSTSPAVLAFYVNGVKVGTSTTLSSTTCQWQQLTTTWASSSATSALVEIRDENILVGGNDFAIDDISVTYETPTVTYAWTGPNSFTASTQNISVTTAGTYTLTVSAPSGCTATASTTIATCPCPTLSNASPSTTIAICAGGTIPSLSLSSNQTLSGTMIEWCAFTAAQSNPYTSTATMYCLQPEANVVNGTITATNLTGMPTILGTYYVYGCLKPVPTDPSCRPFVSYIVTVTANPVPVSVTGGTVCSTGTAQSVSLSATCITGATPTWYSSQTSTTALATATSYSPSVSATTTYYVGCKLTASPNCETATGSRTAVTATVNPTPTAPTISVASGSSLSICSGSSTTLTASACTTGSLLWSTGATTSSITVSPTANTTYSATCVASSCPSVASNNLTVTVTTNVTNGGTIAGNQVNCGAFDPVAFTNVTLPSGGNGTVEYVWMKSTTASTYTAATLGEWSLIIGSTGATYDAPTVSTTTYYIRCSRTAGCSDYVGESNIVSVIINPIPAAPSVTGATICGSGTVNLSATCSTGQTAQWYSSASSNSVLTSGSNYSPSVSSTTVYYVGCKDNTTLCETVGANRTVVTATVNSNPSAPNDATSDKSVLCSGESVTLSGTCAGGTAKWYEGTTALSSLTFTLTNTTTSQITKTYTVGCSVTSNGVTCETPVASRATVTVKVNPIPVAPTNATPSKSAICSGESVTLNGSCSSGNPKWYEGTTLLSSTTLTLTNSTASPIIKTYTVGCSSSSNGNVTCETLASDRATVTVTVNPTPTAPTISVASGSSLSICSGSSTTLTASTCAIGSILWSTGATTSSITVSPTANTTYSATCVASSCSSIASNNLTVTVTTNVTNGGTIAGNQVNCGAFDPVAFTNVTLPSGGNGTVEYVWMKSTTASTYTAATLGEWSLIIGSTGATYDAPTISTTTYYIRCSRTAGCSDYVGESNIVSVIINPTQSVTATGTTKCLGEIIQLSANSTTSSTYSWSGPGTYTSTLQNPIVTGLTAGTYSYTVTVTGTGGCTATANATVIINSIPVAPTVTGATICGSGSVNLSATCSTGQTAQWYSSTSSSTVLVSGGTYSPSVSSTTTYYVGCKDNTTLCETAGANRTAVTATVNSNPLAPSDAAGSKAVICSGESVTLSGTCVGGTAKWYEGTTALSSLTFSLTNTTNAQITKTYTVGCSVTSNGATCETPAASRATVSVKVNPIPAAPTNAKSDKTEICSGETIVLSGTCLSGTAKWYDGATLVSNLTQVLTNTTTAQTTKVFTVACSENNGATCETAVADRATVTIKINPIPAKPTGLTPATTLCGSGSVDLVATCSLGKVNWYNGTTKLTTSPVASGVAFPVTVSATTTYTASCVDDSKTTLCETAPADRVSTTITVNSNPLAPTDAAGSKAVICSGESVTLSGTCVGGTAKWYEGTTSLSSLTFSLTNTTTAQITKTYTVGCSVTSNGATCETPVASRATVTVKVNPIPAAPTNAKSDKTEICSGETITLSGTCLSGTAKWYDGATLVSNLTQVLTNTTTAQTTKVFTVGCSESNGATCETAVGDRATVTIKVNPIPAKPTGLTPATTLCGSGSVDLVATCSLGKVNWYNGTTKLTTSPVASGIAFPVTVSATTTYTASCVDDSKTTLCETAPADRVSTTITVNSNPLAPTDAAGSKAVICSGESVALSGTCVGGTAKWYEGTTSLSSLTFSLTNTTTAQITKTYTVGCSVTSNGATCETPVASRATVTVKVNPIPAAPTNAKSDKTEICSGETIVLSGTCLSGTAKWYDGTTLVSNLTQVLTNTTTAQTTKVFTVGCSESNGATCETAVADRATVTIKVNPIPAKPTGLTPATTLCGSGSVDLVATCSLGKVNWYNGTTKLTTSPVASGVAFPVTVSATTTYTASCVDDSKTTLCETAPADRVSTTITVNSNPLAPTDAAGSKAVICSGESVTLSGTCVGGTAKWYEGMTSLSSLTFSLTNTTTAQITKTYTVGCSVTSNGATCETPVASRATVTVKVNPIPAAPTNAKSDKTEICSGETITLSGTCLSGTAKWYDGATLVSNLSPVLTNTGTSQITKTYTVGCSESNGATCETAVADRATVTVKVNPIPAKPTGLTPATTLCGSGSVDLVATCSLGKVNWYNGTTKLTTDPVASGVAFPVTVSATTTYTASCVDNSKTTLCETAPADRVSTTITVNSNPLAPTDAAGSKAVICSGESVTLSGTCVGGTAKWYEGTTSLSSLTFTLSNTTTAQITKTYTVGCSVTSNGATCETPAASRATVTVKVNPIPAAPTNAKSDKTEICSGETITLSGTCLSGTAKWYDGTTLVSNLTQVLTNTTTAQTTKVFTVGCSESNGATCETAVADRATVTIKVNPIPAKPTDLTPATTLCGSGSVDLVATCSLGKVNWYNGSTKLTTSPVASGVAFPVTVSATTTYTASCVDDSKTTLCETAPADRVSTTITVNSNPLAPSDAVGNKAVICSGETVTLSGTCVGGTAKWYEGTTALSSLTFTLTNTTTAQITKTYTVGCSVTSNGATCETPVASRATVSVKVNPIPAAPTNAKSDKTEICSGETIVLSGTCLSGTAKWYDGTTLVSNLTQVLTNTTTAQTTKVFTVACSESNGATCETAVADRATVTIKINPIPAKPTGLTPATTLCGSGSVDLVATCSLGKVNWYNGTTKLTTSPVASGVAFPVTVSATTTYTASCVDDSKTTLCETAPADRVSTTITVNSNPLAPTDAAGSKAVICSGESVTLSGTCVGGTAKWYEGTTSLSSLTFTLSNTTTAQITKTYTVGCSVTSNGATCETPVGSRATVTVKVNPIPAAPSDAKSDKTEICSGETITLSGTCLSGTAKWYDGTTLVSNLTQVLTNTGTSQITKTYTVGCSESNGATCETAVADRATVTVKINPIPAKPTGLTPATTLCGSGSIDLVATCSLGKVNWYNGSTKLTTSPVASGVAFPVTVSATTTYTASCVDDSKTTLCETAVADRVSTTITVNSNPLAPTDAAGSKAVICSGESVTLSGTCVGGTAKWYEGTTSLSSLTFSLTNTTTAQITKTYTVGCSVTSNGATCETPVASRATVTVKVNPIPAAPTNAKSDKTEICSGETITLSGTCLSGTAKWYDGATLVSNLTQVLTNTTTAQTTKVFTVGCSESNGATCETAVADRATVTIKVNPIPAKPTGLTPATTLCGSGSVDLVATCSLGKVNWYNGTTKLTTSPVASGVAFPVTVSATTTYTASCVDDSKTTLCETAPADRVSTTITVNSNPLAPTDAAGSKAVICSGESVTLSGTCVGGTAKWYEGTTSLSSLTFSLTNTTTAQITKTYTVGCSVTSNGATCETPVASRATVTVKVNPIPAAPTNAKSDKTEICSGETITLSGTCLSGTAKWYDGATLVSNLTQVLTNTTTAQTTKVFTVGCSESNGATCETAVGDRATVTIKINPIPDSPTFPNGNEFVRCGEGDVTVTASGCVGGTIKWYDAPSAGNLLGTGAYTIVGLTTTKDVYAECVSAAGCTSIDRVKATATVTKLPSTPVVTAVQRCGEGSVTFKATGCTNGTLVWYTTSIGGTALATNASYVINADSMYVANVLSSTSYYVECKIENSCVSATRGEAKVTITENVVEGGTIAADQTHCGPFDPVAFTSTSPATGGNGVVEYMWMKSTTASNLTPQNRSEWTVIDGAVSETYDSPTVSTTTYFIRCSRTKGCTEYNGETNILKVTVNAVPTVSARSNSPVCAGSEAVLTAIGDAANGYTWTGPNGFNVIGQQVTVPSLTTKGTYKVTVRTDKGCIATDSITVLVNNNPEPVISAPAKICLGDSLHLSVSGGSTWSWTGTNFTSSVQSPVLKPTTAGTYNFSVTVSGTGGCTGTATTSVIVNALPVVKAVNDTICAGETGTLVASGASTYSWSGNGFSATGSSINVSQAGTYTVVGTDVNGCESSSTATLFINAKPSVKLTSNSPVCSGSNAMLTATGDAGSTYVWSGANGFSATGSSVTIPNFTTSGTYKVTVRTDKGCTATDSITVLVNNNPEPIISAPAKICLGDSLHLSVSGGSTWSWTGTNFTSIIQSPVLKPTTAGTYNFSVTVSGTGGCTGTATTSVIVNPLPVVKAVNDTICAGETGTLVASGASTYSWSGNGFSATGSSINVSQAGTYTVVGTDVNGCESSSTATLFINAKPSVKLTSNSPVCLGSNAMLTATGDAGSTYVWSGSNGFSATGSSVTIPNFTTSGTYKVVVTSDKGCVSTDSITVLVNNNPEPVISAPAKICLGDSLHLSVSGGSTWSWTGTNFTSNVQSPVLKPTTAGTYNFSVTVSGTGGCTGTATTSVIVNALPVVKAVNDTICAGETGVLVASGASTYSWSGNGFSATGSSINVSQAGTYTVVGTDVNGCESSATATLFINAKPSVKLTSNSPVCLGSNAMLTATGDAGSTYVWSGSNGFSATGSSVTIPNFTTSGIYKVVVTSDKGCVSTDSITVLVNNNPEPVISAPAKICLGDSLHLSVSGGSTWSWTGTNFTSSVQSPVLKPTTAGTYNFSVTVSGTGGCTGTATTSVIVNALPVVKAVNDTICAGETGTLVASGASTYSWSGNGFSATGSSINVTQAGTYTVVGTDVNGCESSATATLFINAKPSVKLTSNSPICLGSNAMLTATGDAGSTYVWSGSNGFSATGSSVTIPNFTTSGNYKVVVTSDKGCIATDSITVLVNNNPEPVISAPAKICLGDSLHLSVSGGSTWSWTGTNFTSSVQSPVLKPTTAGTYNFSVTVSGTGGCTGTATTSVIVNALPVVKAVNDTICAGETGTLVASGASTYSWSGNGVTTTGSSINVTQAGTYTVVGTDVNGCESSATATLFINAKPSVKLTSNSPVCLGSNAMLTATGDAGSTYVWSGANGFSATGSSVTIPNFTTSGNYKVVVTSDKGCVSTDSITVLVNNNPEPVISAPAKICLGDSLHLSVSGGSTWSWTGTNFTSTIQSPVLKPTTAGTYNFSVTVSGTGGCTGTATTSVIVNPLPVVEAAGGEIFEGDTLTLEAIGAATYTWTGPNGYTATGATPKAWKAGSYIVIGTDENGCKGTDTTEVTIRPPLVCGIPLDSVLEVCNGSVVTLRSPIAGTYTWKGPNGFIATGDSVTVSTNATTALNGWYVVTGATEGGCTIIPDSIQVIVKDNPHVQISGDSLMCVGGKVVLKVNAIGTYAWTGPNGFSSTSDSAVVTQAGVYSVSVTNKGCVATGTKKVSVDSISVTATAMKQALCTGDTLRLSALVKAASGVNSVSWTNGKGFTSTKLSPTVANVSLNESGIYTVTAVSNGGCTATANVEVVVNRTPVPVITAPTKICLGDSIHLSVNDGKVWSWTGSNGFVSELQNPSLKPTQAGTYTYTVTVAEAAGCTATAKTTVIVNPLPVVVATGGVIYTGDTLTLQVTGASTYTWTGPRGYTATGATPKAWRGGIYTVIGTDLNGCKAVDTAVVTVRPRISCKLTVDSLVEVCKEGTVTVHVSGAENYVWTGPNNFTATGDVVTISTNATASLNGLYIVTGTTSLGCTAQDTVRLVVKDNPSVQISGDSLMCVGGKVVLKVNAIGTYAWTGPNGFSSTSDSAVVTQAGVYSVSVTNKGCVATGTKKVSVDSISVTATAMKQALCTGDTLRLSALAKAVSGVNSVSWTNGKGFTSTELSPIVTNVSLNESGIYTVTAVSNGGCTATANVEVVVNRTPVPVITAPTKICLGDSIHLSVNDGKVWSWTGSNGFVSELQNPSLKPTQAGTYTYTVTVAEAAGCTATATTSVIVNPLPIVEAAGGGIYEGDTLTLEAIGAETYVWTGPNGYTATGATPKAWQVGSYIVIGTDLNGCKGSDTTEVTLEQPIVCRVDLDSLVEVCTGSTAVLSTPTAGTYTWTGPNGFTATGDTIMVSTNATVALNGWYILTGETEGGCIITPDSVLLVVKDNPSVQIMGDSLLCVGGSTTLSVRATGTYLWIGPNDFSSTSDSITVTTPGVYTVSVTNANGCVAIGAIHVKADSVQVKAIASSASVCTGGTVSLSMKAKATSGIGLISWTHGDFATNDSVVVINNITSADAGWYVATVVSRGGCNAVDSVNVTVNPIVTSDTTISFCKGNTTTLVAPSAVTYLWNTGAKTATVSADTAGVYTVQMTDVTGCISVRKFTVSTLDKPSATTISLTAVSSTCNGDVALNDGKVTLAGTQSTERYDMVEGATYTGTANFASAKVVPTGGVIKSSIANPTTAVTYTVRIFNSNDCYTDKIVTLQPVVCTCPPVKCAPYTIKKVKSARVN